MCRACSPLAVLVRVRLGAPRAVSAVAASWAWGPVPTVRAPSWRTRSGGGARAEDCVTVSRGCGVYCLGTVAACDPGSGTRGVFAGRDLASVSRAWSCALPLRCVLCFDVAHQQPRLRLRFCGCALARGVVTQQLGGRLPRCMQLTHVRGAGLQYCLCSNALSTRCVRAAACPC